MQEQIQFVCAWTNRIQHEGRWVKFEEFLSKNLNRQFSHGISEAAANEMMAKLRTEDAEPKEALRGQASAGWN